MSGRAAQAAAAAGGGPGLRAAAGVSDDAMPTIPPVSGCDNAACPCGAGCACGPGCTCTAPTVGGGGAVADATTAIAAPPVGGMSTTAIMDEVVKRQALRTHGERGVTVAEAETALRGTLGRLPAMHVKIFLEKERTNPFWET